jgi:integrase
VANKRVNIYERLKINGEWTDRPVQLPKLTREETLNPKDDRSGRFYVTWYDGQKKCRHPEPLILLSDAVNIKVAKEFYLRNCKRAGVTDTTIPKHRLPLRASPEEYLSSLSGCKKTKTAHRQAVCEFLAWNTKICEYEFRKEFVDQIDKAHLMRFMDYLVDDDPDNCPFTAAWKLMRVNKWIRSVLHLDAGKGPIKKSDLRRELESNAVAEIYTQGELKAVFAVMGEEEFLRYETLLKSGLRKKELMYLEEDDAIIDLRPDGKEKREIRVERKNHYDFIPKNGKSRNVPIPRDLAERLSVWKEKKRASKLLFSTKTGAPDGHMLEKLRSIAKRAGLDAAHFWLHKFRATYAVGRLRAGVDPDTLREWLGHKDTESLRAYMVHLKNEEAIALGKVDAGHVVIARASSPLKKSEPAEPVMQVPLSPLTLRELRWS